MRNHKSGYDNNKDAQCCKTNGCCNSEDNLLIQQIWNLQISPPPLSSYQLYPVHVYSDTSTVQYSCVRYYRSVIEQINQYGADHHWRWVKHIPERLVSRARVQSPESKVQSPHDSSPLRGYTSPESRGESPVSSVQRRESRVRDPEMKLVFTLKFTQEIVQ